MSEAAGRWEYGEILGQRLVDEVGELGTESDRRGDPVADLPPIDSPGDRHGRISKRERFPRPH
jgi:hypothetical protein